MRIILAKTLLSAYLALPVKVAVIDTGFDSSSKWDYVNPKICKNGFYDATKSDKAEQVESITDAHFPGHGTHVAGLIAQNAGDSNYCMVIMKFYDPKKATTFGPSNLLLERAIADRVDIINFSAGGNEYSKEECDLVKKALDNKIIVVAAMGNKGQDIAKHPFYPASCDKRVVKIENATADKTRDVMSSYSSGKGERIFSANGVNAISTLPNGHYGALSGTSMATAIVTGKITKIISLKKEQLRQKLKNN